MINIYKQIHLTYALVFKIFISMINNNFSSTLCILVFPWLVVMVFWQIHFTEWKKCKVCLIMLISTLELQTGKMSTIWYLYIIRSSRILPPVLKYKNSWPPCCGALKQFCWVVILFYEKWHYVSLFCLYMHVKNMRQVFTKLVQVMLKPIF